MIKILVGVVVGVLLVPFAAAIYLWSGSFDMSATRPPGTLEALVGDTLLARSLERRAPAMVRNPLAPGPETLRVALAHFREDCLFCHGAPGVAPGDAAKGLNPRPPDLARPETQRAADGELFEVIAHGVRMSGMPAWLPTHSERDIWALVVFVRHLPTLGAEERAALTRGEAERGRAPGAEARPEEPAQGHHHSQ